MASKHSDRLGKLLARYGGRPLPTMALIGAVALLFMAGGVIAYDRSHPEHAGVFQILGIIFVIFAFLIPISSFIKGQQAFEIRKGGIRYSNAQQISEMSWDNIDVIDVRRYVAVTPRSPSRAEEEAAKDDSLAPDLPQPTGVAGIELAPQPDTLEPEKNGAKTIPAGKATSTAITPKAAAPAYDYTITVLGKNGQAIYVGKTFMRLCGKPTGLISALERYAAEYVRTHFD